MKTCTNAPPTLTPLHAIEDAIPPVETLLTDADHPVDAYLRWLSRAMEAHALVRLQTAVRLK
jgi:hypothetical protein